MPLACSLTTARNMEAPAELLPCCTAALLGCWHTVRLVECCARMPKSRSSCREAHVSPAPPRTLSLQRFGSIDPGMVFETAATASGVAVAAAFASAVPMWYCLACPAVLGLALPLAINLGLGEMVNVICDHFNFGPEQCMDLGVAALAVGFVLALASALPIFKVCKMYECEHRPPAAAASP